MKVKRLNIKHVCTCCFLLSCGQLCAQEIEAKSFSVSGTASLEYIEGSEMSTYQKQSDYSGAAQANYFLWNDISLNFGYRFGIENRLSGNTSAANSYKKEYQGGFAQLRKYWFFKSYLGVYVNAEYGYSVGTIIQDHKVELADKEHQQNLYLIPGIFILPLKKFGIELSYGSLGYSSSILKDEDGKKAGSASGFNLSLRPDLHLGVHYFILRK